jgi:hypothetical protein
VRPVFFKKAKYSSSKGSCTMMFELLLDVMERLLNLRDAKLPWKELYSRREISKHKFAAF